jgi:exonuclease SbcD
VLKENPLTIYSGSLERLDFGDENDEKGFYVINIDNQPDGDGVPACNRRVSYQFHSVDARRFFTLSVDIEPHDPDPASTVFQAVDACQDKIKDAIVRVDISIPADLSGKLRDADVRSKIKDAYYLTIARDIRREERLRMGKGSLEGITPSDALKAWLEAKYPVERARVLLEYGEKLIRENTHNGQTA